MNPNPRGSKKITEIAELPSFRDFRKTGKHPSGPFSLAQYIQPKPFTGLLAKVRSRKTS